MKTPAFWYQPAGFLAFCLRPFGWVYGYVTGLRMARSGLTVDVPVICVGNFTAGGAGKTPTVIALLKLLAGMGERPFVVSRGYGGSLHGPLRVDPALHKSTDCGDEPLLLARHAPTVVAKDRASGVKTAIDGGASVVVLDDGMQSSAVHKDVTVCVVDGGVGLGNGLCVPAGPLRAPFDSQLAFVDLVVILGAGQPGQELADTIRKTDILCINAGLLPNAADVMKLRGKPLQAFAGIGRPEKFFQTLRMAGLDVVGSSSFADHQVYSRTDLDSLSKSAAQQNLTLVTTEKDAVRIGPDMPGIMTLGIKLQWDEAYLLKFLETHIAKKRSGLKNPASIKR